MSERIDAAFVPKRSPRVHGVELDGEAVLYDARSGRLHFLNWSGHAVWSSLDGETPVGELAVDLAEAFDSEIDAMRADIIQLLERLGDQGLLENVEAEAAAAVRKDERLPMRHARPKETDA